MNLNRKRSAKLLFSILLQVIIITSTISAQHTNILIGGSINDHEPEEPSVVVNPQNTNEILVGSNSDNYYYSTDAGLTWTHRVLQSTYTVIADPCVLVDSDNNYYYFHLVDGLSRVVCQKTSSLTSTFNNGSYTGINGTKDNDKEWAAVDRNNNYLYVAWAQFDEHGSINPQDSSEILLSRSTDQGENWSDPVVISDGKGNAMGGAYSMHAPMPAVGPNGEVYVTWMSPGGVRFDKSTDYGLTWLENDVAVTQGVIQWLYNVPGLRFGVGFPIICADTSNTIHRGNIYISWTQPGTSYSNPDVFMVKSTDGGENWSARIRVNDDQSSRKQFDSWMTIDQVTGYILFVYYDRRNYNDSRTDVYMAVSKDGGATFTNFRISESPFVPNANYFFGDYIGISAHNNVIRPVWTRMENNNLSLWTAVVDPNNLTSVDQKENRIYPDDFEITSIYPNPFNPSTSINFSIAQDGFTVIRIYDILGKVIKTLLTEHLQAGDHRVEWLSENEASGVYLINLQFENYSKVKKAVLAK